MKIVYVLVSSDDDYFAEMGMVSICSLRLVDKQVNVELVVDTETYLGLTGHRKKILDMIDNLNIVDISQNDPLLISRFLKTNLRSLVRDRFLYLDLDAVPVKSLSMAFGLNCDIALSLDMGCLVQHSPYYDKIRSTYSLLGWPIPQGAYYNAGVMLVDDKDSTRSLFRMWHQFWKKHAKKVYVWINLHLTERCIYLRLI